MRESNSHRFVGNEKCDHYNNSAMGCPTGTDPAPPASQASMLNHYTMDTIIKTQSSGI